METYEILIAIALIAVVILIMIMGYLMTRTGRNEPWRREIKDKLKELTILSNNDDEIFIKTAIMEADKLLEFVLQRYNVPGETLGEKLNNSQKYFSRPENMERAWNGHKVRNSLAHDLGFRPNEDQLRLAFADIAAAIRDLAG